MRLFPDPPIINKNSSFRSQFEEFYKFHGVFVAVLEVGSRKPVTGIVFGSYVCNPRKDKLFLHNIPTFSNDAACDGTFRGA